MRSYRVRAKGVANETKLSSLRQGITVDGIRYRPMELNIIKQNTSNVWLSVRLMEGKNREIRLRHSVYVCSFLCLIETEVEVYSDDKASHAENH